MKSILLTLACVVISVHTAAIGKCAPQYVTQVVCGGADQSSCEAAGCCWNPHPNVLTRCTKSSFIGNIEDDCDAEFGESCYRIFDDPLFYWKGAQAACVTWGGSLVEIGSSAEQTAIEGMLRKWQENHQADQIWIGANDLEREGRFVWAKSKNPLSYTKWWSGEPNNSRGKEDCATIMVDLVLNYNRKGFGYWNDMPCTSCGKPFICEKDGAEDSGSGCDD